MPSSEKGQGQVRLADNGTRVGKAQAKQNDGESKGSCGRGRSQAGQRGEAGRVRERGKARQACGVEQSWCCIPGFSLERNFCIPLAFIMSQKFNSEARIEIVHRLSPV